VAGGLTTFSLLAAASIGLFVLPAALLALWIASRGAPRGPEPFGLFAGAAAVCFLITWIQREPGGLDSLPWLVAGLVLAALGIGGYAALERRGSRPA
jgi:hypothetical protein